MAKKQESNRVAFEEIYARLESLIGDLMDSASGPAWSSPPPVDAAIRRSVALLDFDEVRPNEPRDLCEITFEMISRQQRDAFRTLRGLGKEGHYALTLEVMNELDSA